MSRFGFRDNTQGLGSVWETGKGLGRTVLGLGLNLGLRRSPRGPVTT